MPRTHLSLHLGQAVFLWAGQHVQSAPHEHASPHLQLHSGFGREEHSGGSVLLAKALGQGRASQEGQGQCFLRPPTQPRALHAVLVAPQPGCGSHFTEIPSTAGRGPSGRIRGCAASRLTRPCTRGTAWWPAGGQATRQFSIMWRALQAQRLELRQP